MTTQRSLTISLANALSLAAAFCLIPMVIPFEASTAARWTVFGTGIALLTAPLLGRIWLELLDAFGALARRRERIGAALAAMSGQADALVIRVRGRVGGWADASLVGPEGERSGSITMSTFQRLPRTSCRPSLDMTGCWFLLRGPIIERPRQSLTHAREVRIVDSARVDFLGVDGQWDTRPAPLSTDVINSLIGLTACHVIVLEVVVITTFSLC